MDNLRKDEGKDVYIEVALSQIPRLLTLMDRKKGFNTYGSCDRPYWRYRSIDFASSNNQIGALPLALVYKNNYPNNIYYRNPKIRDWAIAAMEFLPRTQNPDGTLNETHPYIWVVAATAFPVYAVSQAYMLLKEEVPAASKEIILKGLELSGKWLLTTSETQVVNQESAAAIALYNLYEITRDEKYKKGAEAKIKRIISSQTEEGWFNEYGGGDIAYLTITICCLARYYKKTLDKDVLNALKKSIAFISYFVHPNGTMGGEYSSRNSEFIIPSGFEIIAKEIPLAAAIADSNIEALRNREIVIPEYLDNTFLCFMLHNFFEAYDNYQPREGARASLPCKQPGITKYFPLSGNLVVTRDNYYLVSGMVKGGVIRIYNPGLFFSDCGFIGKLATGELISSQWLDYSDKIAFKPQENSITVHGVFHKVNQTLSSPKKMVISRIVMPLIGKFSLIRAFICEQLRRLMITRSGNVPIEFGRQILYNKESIKIIDSLQLKKNIKLKWLVIEDKFSTRHGSSKEIFQRQELMNIKPIPEDNLIEYFKEGNNLTIIRELSPREGAFKYEIKRAG